MLAMKWRDITRNLSRWQVALLCLVVACVVLVLAVPEASVLLPLMDAVGWDIFAILIAFQLRHYVVIAYRISAAPILRVGGAVMPQAVWEAYYALRSGDLELFSAPWWSIALFGARAALPVVAFGLSIPVLLVAGLRNSGFALH
ncbi:MAG TPA: hypothetical protein VHX52_13410 [Steroidobacteraceae bacterium]|jgi:hypothetical protein|nr:hypothetical protein [Steroidobacteraceae bacterium]